jgi:arabinofuranosyltransferase
MGHGVADRTGMSEATQADAGCDLPAAEGGARAKGLSLRAASFLPWLGVLAFLARDQFFLTEDSFIAFRYVRNLVEGHGLVYNLAERVEGCVNVLWLLELGALWSWFGIRPETGVHAISLFFTAATLGLAVRLALDTPFREHRWMAAWMAAGLLACSATFAAWSTGGLETRQFTFLVLLGVFFLARASRPGALLAASFALAAAELTRPEAMLIWGCCMLWLTAVTPKAPRILLPALLRAGLPFAVIVGAQFLVRHAYYGDWLPNPYYAKHVRPWYEAGLRYVANGAIETGMVFTLPLTALAGVALRREGRGRLHAFSLLCILPHAAYLARIGGDHFEHRPMDVYGPLLAVGAADGMLVAGSRLCRAVLRRPSLALAGVTVPLFALLLVYSSALQGAFWAATRHLDRRSETILLNRTLSPRDLPVLLRLPGLGAMMRLSNALRAYNIPHLVGIRVKEHAVYARERRETWRPYEALPRGLIPRSAVAGTAAAGAMPFYLADLTVIDMLGLTDRTVARQPVATPNAERMMAHDRRATPAYLASRGVNINVLPPARSRDEALRRAPFAVQAHADLWMPFETNDPDWARRAFPPGALFVRPEGPR